MKAWQTKFKAQKMMQYKQQNGKYFANSNTELITHPKIGIYEKTQIKKSIMLLKPKKYVNPIRNIQKQHFQAIDIRLMLGSYSEFITNQSNLIIHLFYYIILLFFFKCHSPSIFEAASILSFNVTPITNLINNTKQQISSQIYNNIINFFAHMQSPAQSRRNRIATIRASLQEIPAIKKNSIQNRISKRRMSLKLEGDPELKLIQEKLNQKEDNTVSQGKFNQKYELGQKIGEGSNGFVKKCFVRSTREVFAVKSIQTDQEHIMFLKANFKYIKELNHPNIVRYHLMYLDNKKNICNLVMDYDSHPCLLDYHDLNEDQIRQIMFQLLSTLAYIHSKNICHRDIKPENILYDRQNRKIKLIDFGISKKLQNRGYKKDMLTITGTLYYRAPEMFLGGGYDEKVDVWAAGVTLYQLLSHGKTPFESDFLSTTIQNIIKGDVQYPDEPWNRYNKFAKDLVSRLLRKRQERLTATEAKKHFWFEQNYDEGCIDLTKSDSTKIQFGLRKKQVTDHIDEQFKFERSLTNTFSTQTGTQMTKGNQKGKNILKKWLADGSDDDVLIDVESEEDDEQNVAIETKN